MGSPQYLAKMPQTEQTFEQTTHDFSGSQSISMIQSGYLKSQQHIKVHRRSYKDNSSSINKSSLFKTFNSSNFPHNSMLGDASNSSMISNEKVQPHDGTTKQSPQPLSASIKHMIHLGEPASNACLIKRRSPNPSQSRLYSDIPHAKPLTKISQASPSSKKENKCSGIKSKPKPTTNSPWSNLSQPIQ